VQIGGTQSGIGPAAGAAAGGIVGSQIGRGSGNAAAVLAGVLIGGVTGAVVEEATTRQAGIEYVLQSDNGALLTLIQGTNPAFVLGQKVVIIYGTQSRIIAVPD
jgi:outer membrane lipoprotein SlyB